MAARVKPLLTLMVLFLLALLRSAVAQNSPKLA